MVHASERGVAERLLLKLSYDKLIRILYTVDVYGVAARGGMVKKSIRMSTVFFSSCEVYTRIPNFIHVRFRPDNLCNVV